MSNETVYVAVYGSLRRMMSNHRVNGYANAELVGLGHTIENYDLYGYGGAYFPSVSLAHSAANKPVRVEVYKTTMDGLAGPYDTLEGYPNFYNRTQVAVQLDSGEEVTCWIYHIDNEQPVLVESGDWCLHKKGENYYDDLDN